MHTTAIQQQQQFTGCQEPSQPSSDLGLSRSSANPSEQLFRGLAGSCWINLLGSFHTGHTLQWIFIFFFFFFLQLWINISLQILQKWLSRGYDVPEFSPLWLLEILSQRHVIEKHCPEAPALYFCFTQDSSSSFICIFFFQCSISMNNQGSPETATLQHIFFHISIKQKHRHHPKLILSNDSFQYQQLLLKMLSVLIGLTVLLFYATVLYCYLFILLYFSETFLWIRTPLWKIQCHLPCFVGCCHCQKPEGNPYPKTGVLS